MKFRAQKICQARVDWRYFILNNRSAFGRFDEVERTGWIYPSNIMVVVMGLLFANRMHVLLLAGVLAASGALLPGCGLFGDIPEFGGTDSHLEPISDAGADSQSAPDTLTQRECTAPADCPALANMSATCAEHRCVYTCEQGFVDVDGSIATNGCECASSAEVCDGEDNDCDGFVDNLFGQGQ